jgi:16S rRNA (cytosine1402-N4)-methyltransferase
MHIPVLQKEVLEYLDPQSNKNFIDCTVGEGGHSSAIIEKISPQGKVLGIDWDQEAVENLRPRERLIPVHDNFVNLKEIVKKYKLQPDGVLLDLGFSSRQIEKDGRGFSFQKDERLDMRYNQEVTGLTAEKIINNFSQSEIIKILKEYGEERFAKRIANKIVEEKKIKLIKTTLQLVEIIKKATPSWYHHQKIHFATRTFQALRIAVNDEIENIKNVLPQALEVLKPSGRLVIISFHSLEDRIIKNFLRNQAKEGLLKILTKKPIRPTKEEVEANPRSRSAKLRAAQKVI